MSTTAKKDQFGQATDKAKEAAGHAAGAARDLAGQAADKASDLAGQAGDAVKGAANYVGQKADDATSAVGQGIQSAAGTVRDSGPQSGVLGSATRGVADAMESAGKYLDDKNVQGMMNDVSGLITRNPIPAVLLGLGIGFLIGRALSSSSSNSSSYRSY